MSDRNYWTSLRQRKISRRTMLGASAKAGVGVAGLALVGCGDDDEPAAVDTSAIDAAAGDASAAAEAASDAAAAAGRAAEAAEAASALAADAAASEDAEQAAAAAQAAADAAADAAEAARAAGDAGAAAVAQAAADAAEAAAQAAREAGAEDTAAGAAAAQAAADAAAAAAAAAQDASAAAAEAAALAAEAVEAVDAAREEIAAAVSGEALGFSVPWPLDQIDLDASIVAAVVSDNGGLDQMRSGSQTNYYSHGAVFNAPMELDPRDNTVMATVATPEQIDPVTIRAAITPAPFHDGSTVTAHDLVFSYQRVGGAAEYHDGGAATDHPGGWATCCGVWGSNNWARSEAVDDRTWEIELLAPDASFLLLHMTRVNVSVFSKADTERRGDTAVDQSPMGTGPYRFVSHTDDEDFVYERFEDHLNPIDHPVRVPHVPHNKQLTVLVRPELQSRLAGLEAGEIDLVGGGWAPMSSGRSWTTPTSPSSSDPPTTGPSRTSIPTCGPRRWTTAAPTRSWTSASARPRTTRSTASPSSTTCCSAWASSHSSHTAAPRATRPRSRSRKSPTPTTPSGRGRCWRRPATRTASTPPSTGRPTGAARTSRTWCWRSRRT